MQRNLYSRPQLSYMKSGDSYKTLDNLQETKDNGAKHKHYY